LAARHLAVCDIHRRDIALDETAATPESLERVTATLVQVSGELAAWVPILRRLAQAEALRNAGRDHGFEISAGSVRSLIAARRLREQHFWPAMSEGAWDMLLELFACRLEGRRLDAAALGEAIGLPIDSTLHWIDAIAARGMISRRIADGEKALIDLTVDGADRMRAYLLAALSLSPWAQ
jgi:hypothetical protein